MAVKFDHPTEVMTDFNLKLQNCIDPNGGEPGISSQGMSRRSLAKDCSAA